MVAYPIPQTISTAITAAETGHLVLAILHIINAAQTVERLIDVFPSYQQQQITLQLSNCLRAIVSRRLFPHITDDRMVVATELLIYTNAIKNLIRDGKYHQIPNVIFTGSKFGMLTMEASMQYLIDRGLINPKFLNHINNDDVPIDISPYQGFNVAKTKMIRQ